MQFQLVKAVKKTKFFYKYGDMLQVGEGCSKNILNKVVHTSSVYFTRAPDNCLGLYRVFLKVRPIS